MYRYKDLQLRPIEKLDLSFLREFHNDYLETTQYLTDVHMVNDEEQNRWYESLCQSNTSMRFLVVYENEKIGCIRFDNYDKVNRNIQVGGDIHPNYRGKGLGKMMFLSCLNYSFEVLNCHRVYLNVLETNDLARNMYNRCGMEEEGVSVESICRNGRYLNCINMYMTEKMYISGKE